MQSWMGRKMSGLVTRADGSGDNSGHSRRGKVIRADEAISDASFAQMIRGMARLLHLLITAEQPRPRIPKPAKPKISEVCFSGADAKHPASNIFGDQLTPTQEAVNVER